MQICVTFRYKSDVSRVVDVDDPHELYDLAEDLRDSITDEDIVSNIVDNDWDWEYE